MARKLLFPIPDRGLAKRLYRIRARTAVIWGNSDRLIAPVYADEFVRRIPAATLEALLANLRWADLRLKTSSLDPRCVIEEALLAAHAVKTLASPPLPA